MYLKYFNNLQNLISIIIFFYKRISLTFFFIILLLFITNLIESIGLIALIPLFELILNQNNEINSQNFLTNIVLNFLVFLNIKPTIVTLVFFILIIFILKFIFLISTYNFISYISANMQSDFQKTLVYDSFDSKWDYFNKKPLGVLSNTIGLETKIIANMFQRVCVVFTGILQGILVFIITISINAYYSTIALVIGVLLFLLFNFLTEIAKKIGELQAMSQQNLIKKYSDILQGLKSYKASEKISYIKLYILKHIIDLKNSNFKLNYYKYLQNFSKEPVIIIIICIFLITNYNSKIISNNDLIIFIILLYRILVSVNVVQLNYTNILSQYGYFESVNTLMEKFKVNLEKKDIHNKKISFEKKIQLKNISFNFHNKKIFSDFNLEINKNSLTMIYGESGVGKTTLIDLLTGLYKPTKGNIFIDNIDLENLSLSSWRKKIEYVQQELFLINDTIRENITFGNNKINDQMIWDVLNDINSKEFVNNLELKLDQKVGERGSILSGGQRQRIAFARSIINKPEILILDEVTASLDKNNEKIIFEFLLKLKENVTIIYITHQKELIKYADKAVYIEKL